MPRFTLLVACVFALAALTADSARADYVSGGTPTNSDQIRGNQPQPRTQIVCSDLGNFVAVRQLQLLAPPPPKPLPVRKPLAKPPVHPANGDRNYARRGASPELRPKSFLPVGSYATVGGERPWAIPGSTQWQFGLWASRIVLNPIQPTLLPKAGFF
jgi:hypothetical protein